MILVSATIPVRTGFRILYKLRSSSVQERSVFILKWKVNMICLQQCLFDLGGGEFERKFFRLPGYFELSRVLE